MSQTSFSQRFLKRIPQVRILPLTIAVAALCVCVRTVDLLSLASAGQPIPLRTAMAETAPPKPAKTDAPVPKSASVPAHDEAPAPIERKSRPPEQSFSPSELEVLQSLSERRAALEQRERALDGREALLKAAEQRLDQKVAELNRLKGELEVLVKGQKKAEEAQSESLVKIYENMKPKDAARIFDTLDLDVLTEVAGRMKELKMAPILASMDENRAREVTMRLHARKQLPAGMEANAQARN